MLHEISTYIGCCCTCDKIKYATYLTVVGAMQFTLSRLEINTVVNLYRNTAVPAEGNGDLQTLICVLVTRLGRCPTLSNPVP